MKTWLKIGLGVAALAWLVFGVVAFVDDRLDRRQRAEDYRQTEGEWAYWIESCNLPSDLAVALSEELASWSPFAPSDLMSDFGVVAALEAQVMSELRPAIEVPTEFSGFIRYRLRQADSTLPRDLSPGPDVIDRCAKDAHEAMVAFERRVDAEVGRLRARTADRRVR